MELVQPGDWIEDYQITNGDPVEGGQGTVFEAEGPIGERVVLKRIDSDDDALAMALNEARSLVEIDDHPNVVNVIGVVEDDNEQHYVVMDFVDGDTLGEHFSRVVRMEPMHWWQFLRPLLSGLSHIHKKGVVHGDIKPDNIIIAPNGDPVLVDFGAARASGRMADELVYTSLYAPREAREFGYLVQPHFDLYAMAVVSYEAMLGPIPTTDDGGADIRAMRDDLDQDDRFQASIAQAMEVNPSKRPQSVLDWLAEMAVPMTATKADTQGAGRTTLKNKNSGPQQSRIEPRPWQPSGTGTSTVAWMRDDIEAYFGLSKDAVRICDMDGTPYGGSTHIGTVSSQYGPDYRFEDGVVAARLDTRELKVWIENRYGLPPGSVRFYRPNGHEYGKGSGLANQTQLKTLLELWSRG